MKKFTVLAIGLASILTLNTITIFASHVKDDSTVTEEDYKKSEEKIKKDKKEKLLELANAGIEKVEELLNEEETVESLKNKIDKVKDLKDSAGDIISIIKNIDADSLNLDNIKGSVEGFLEDFVSDTSDEIDNWEIVFQELTNLNNVENEYVKEKNNSEGDVQIFTHGNLYLEELDNPDFDNLVYIIQHNYEKDGDELHFLDYTFDVALFNIHTEDDDTFTINNVEFAEKDEDGLTYIGALADKVGVSMEECMEIIDFNDAYQVEDLVIYMEEHPEIKGIEYQGKICTKEELEKIVEDQMDIYFEEEETE